MIKTARPRGNGRRGKTIASTPVRELLLESSRLRKLVCDGLDALSTDDKKRFDEQLRTRFADSLELDAAMLADSRYKVAHRWDYLIGDAATQLVIALEPHSARSDQVSTVIAKRAAAKDQLKPHLRNGARIAAWLWVASGDVQFADTDKERRRLDEAGITFVGKRVLAKHLPQR
jgi:hypothetical protein